MSADNNDSETEEEIDTVTLTDEDGEDREFAILGVLELEPGTFAVLAPLDQLEEGSLDFDLYAFHFEEDEDGIDLTPVEDDELLDIVLAEAERMLFEDEVEDLES